MKDPQGHTSIFQPDDDLPIRTPFPFCFRGQIVKLLEVEAAGRVLASAQKTPQQPGIMQIFRILPINALAFQKGGQGWWAMWCAAAKRRRHAPFSPKNQKIEIATTCIRHIVSTLIGRFFGNWDFLEFWCVMCALASTGIRAPDIPRPKNRGNHESKSL